jgi:hypothetical protein
MPPCFPQAKRHAQMQQRGKISAKSFERFVFADQGKCQSMA